MASPTRGRRSRPTPIASRSILIASSVAAAAGVSLTRRVIHRRRSGTEPPAYRVDARWTTGDGEAAQQRDGEAVQQGALAAISETRSPVASGSLRADSDLSSRMPDLRRVYRKGRRALARVSRDPTGERWHELRTRSQDLRHAVKLLTSAKPDRVRKVSRRARRLSDLLGEDHDLGLLGERIRAGALRRDDVKMVMRLIGGRRGELQDEAAGVARRLYGRKPDKFIRWLGLA
jgi:hypothetical protein